MIIPPGGSTEEYLLGYHNKLILEQSDFFIAPPDNTRYTLFNAEKIAEKIIVSYLKNTGGKKGVKKNKCRKMHNFDWNTISQRWINILD